VAVSTVATQFTQGNLKITGNNLDMAINGEGLFKVRMTDGSTAYTRNGEFKLDKDGYIITNAGAKVQGFMPASIGGVIPTGITSDLKLPTSQAIAPKQTLGATATDPGITMTANLPSDTTAAAYVAPTAPADLTDAQKKYATSVNVYDQEGNAIPVRISFLHTATGPSVWTAVASVYNEATQAWAHENIGTVSFGPDGKPSAAPTLAITPTLLAADAVNAGIPSAAWPSNIAIGVGDATAGWTLTQYDADFAVNELSQTGYASGELTSISVNEQGIIMANYSNGENMGAGQLSLARFRNVQGLTTLNGGYFQESSTSGQPVEGQPTSGRFGSVRSGALEESNVDLTAELVNMIVAQRAYQANAQTIKTQDQVQSTLVNLR
jgi:flagellar hook protein FlgE